MVFGERLERAQPASKAMSTIYADRTYKNHNPTWHTEDSEWKAQQILKMLARHDLSLKTVCEVGCGAGEVLRQLSSALDADVTYCGYDISQDAYGCYNRLS